MKKILLIHNNPRIRWADTFRAEYLKREWKDDEVDIIDAEHLPDGEKYDVIHFLYSGGITKSKEYILKNKHKVFTSLASKRTLDCLYDKKEDLIRIFKETVCCVCQNKELFRNLMDLIQQDNLVYIPNGVDTEVFNQGFVAGFVGAKGSNEHKGLPIAKQACKELGIRLLEAHEHDYEHDSMPEFYKKIDVLLIPSESEGCHNPTLEALAMNIPVISTNVGIAEELEGVTIVRRDVVSFKNELRKRFSRRNILEKYTWKIIAEKYRNVYVRHLNL